MCVLCVEDSLQESYFLPSLIRRKFPLKVNDFLACQSVKANTRDIDIQENEPVGGLKKITVGDLMALHEEEKRRRKILQIH